MSKAPTVLHTEDAPPVTPISASLDKGHSGYWLDLEQRCDTAGGRKSGITHREACFSLVLCDV